MSRNTSRTLASHVTLSDWDDNGKSAQTVYDAIVQASEDGGEATIDTITPLCGGMQDNTITSNLTRLRKAEPFPCIEVAGKKKGRAGRLQSIWKALRPPYEGMKYEGDGQRRPGLTQDDLDEAYRNGVRALFKVVREDIQEANPDLYAVLAGSIR